MTIQLVLNKNKKLKTVAASFRFFKLLGSSNGQTFSIHLFLDSNGPKKTLAWPSVEVKFVPLESDWADLTLW